jgi:MSHA biogenesis protein MshE
MTIRKKIRIGELLVRHQIITEEQLQTALAEQKRSGSKLGHTLVELGYLSRTGFLKFLAQQLELPYIDLRRYQINDDIVRLLPEIHVRRFRAIVLAEQPDGLLVGMTDPTDIFAFDELRRLLQRPIHPAVVGEDVLLDIVDRIYRRTDEISHIAGELSEELGESGIDIESLLVDNETEDAPVVRLIHTLFEDAVQIGASDIHIEPDESVLRIRQRIDGVLHEQVMNEKRIGSALVSKLKLMSGLDISERRLPQDGRFNIRVRGRSIDIRLSTMPLQYGESVVMRLLDQSGGLLKLDQIGMPETMLAQFRNLVHRPHGLVLVTGPTGSGKTTTLYGALNELNDAKKKIITVEDPVEYRLPRINQVQIQSRIDLSFARVLRAALRQDPDVVMVGEMRDQETVDIGLRSAMTGHLVLSTLHTNDAVSTALRLIDMGAEGFVVGSSLLGILAQRLVRRICDRCREAAPLDDRQRNWLDAMVGPEAMQFSFKRGAGCPRCHNTGYFGRIGVFELLRINTPLADALRHNDSAGFVRIARDQSGFKPLFMAAFEYACQGVTSMEEVMRLGGQIDEFDEVADMMGGLAPVEERAYATV